MTWYCRNGYERDGVDICHEHGRRPLAGSGRPIIRTVGTEKEADVRGLAFISVEKGRGGGS